MAGITLQFATNQRSVALKFLHGYFPDADFDGTEKEVSDFLDLVDGGMFRVPNPAMHKAMALMPDVNFTEANRDLCVKTCETMVEFLTSTAQDPDGKPEGGAM